MNTGSFNVLHDTGYENIFTVTNCVNFEFCTGKIFIYQNRVFNILCQNNSHVFFNVFFIKGNYHILTAKHIRRAEQYGIADSFCYFKGFGSCHNCKAFGAFYMVEFKQFIKTFSVLRHVDTVGRCAENVDSLLTEEFCQFNSRLTAECNYYAIRLFCCNNAHDIFIGKGFKIQSVGCVEVR